MSGFRFVYRSVTGQFSEEVADIYRPIAKAGTAALRAAVDDAKADGRASIAAAGFSKRWQNTLRGDVFPRRGDSADAAGIIRHIIPYADVFETGATIRGKPKLWVPLPSSPKKVSRKKMTPKNFAQSIGPLFPIRSKRGVTLLAAKMSVSAAAARRGPPYRVTVPALRRGASGQGLTRAVPIFAGVSSVQIGRKFSIGKAIDQAVDKLPALYLKHLNAES